MKTRLSLVLALLLLTAGVALSLSARSGAAAEPQHHSGVAKEIIAREKASFEAWQRKDKAFFADFLSDDATYFNPHSPYLDGDPKVNFLPKFEQYAEQMKFLDFQMYNPRVQVYGEVAILTYNHMTVANFGGQQMNYTGKMTSVYLKQGGTWRIVHGHESMNPGAR